MFSVITLPLEGVQNIVISMSITVCLSSPNFLCMLANKAVAQSSYCWHCNTSQLFSHNGPFGALCCPVST